jgi:hypothetical protein
MDGAAHSRSPRLDLMSDVAPLWWIKKAHPWRSASV